jgi:Zn-dependent M32 family carboxypeptidase
MVMSRAFEKALQQQPQIATDLAAGSIDSLNAWMKANVFDVVPLHAYVLDLMALLTGERRLNGDALIRHFVHKYNRLYNMTMDAPPMPAGETYVFV